MDEIDQAQHNDELFRQAALIKHFQGREEVRPDNAVEGIPICMDCENEIGQDRIAANPSAFRCIDCQTKQERRFRGQTRSALSTHAGGDDRG